MKVFLVVGFVLVLLTGCGGGEPLDPGGEGAPENLRVVDKSGSEIELTWDALPGAVKYRVYRSIDNNYDGKWTAELVEETTSLTCTDDPTAPDASGNWFVDYRVTAILQSGGETLYSNAVRVSL